MEFEVRRTGIALAPRHVRLGIAAARDRVAGRLGFARLLGEESGVFGIEAHRVSPQSSP
ncbi:hypothetical protein KRR38_17220 [Novosphingobium sp. G106]|uniref:hypothetical protein n=1 Tax=Novosphingobium sp. G106 TaxID=2849500 RepID=UPI001C2CC818|nr:hypothetical protein [Novosphingobium sp. G106]MBV1689365.1 hypothetical protein [Novosphingobium sp. G106]